MPWSPTRRRTLQIVASVGGTSVTGCLGFRSPSTDESDSGSDDWPSFQRDAGNTGSNVGISAIPDDPKRRWHASGRTSSPVVADETVYVAEFTDERRLVARSLSSGEKRWTAAIPHGQVAPAPAVAGDRVVQHSFGMVHAFERTDGTERWTFEPKHGTPGAPVMGDGAVYVTSDAYQDDPATVTALSLDNGSKRWERSFDGEYASSAAFVGGTVFVGNDDGVLALDSDDGAVRWRVEVPAGVRRAVASDDGVTYATDTAGTLHAINADDGRRQWQTTVGDDGGSATAPTIGDNILYVGTESGVVAVAADDGTVRWEYETEGGIGQPTTDGERVYAGGTDWDDHAIHALDVESGRQRWTRDTDPRDEGDHSVVGVFGPPVLLEDRVLVASATGVSAFEPRDGATGTEGA